MQVRGVSYKIEIFYSAEDEGFIAVIPELPGCSAFGETQEDALKEVLTAQKLWIDASKREGKEIPEPDYQKGPLAGDANRRTMRTVKTSRDKKQLIFA